MTKKPSNTAFAGFSSVAMAFMDDETGKYGDLILIEDAMTLNLALQSETTSVSVNDVMKDVATQNNGFDGTLQLERVDDELATEMFGWIKDDKGGTIHATDAPRKHFLMMCKRKSKRNGKIYIFPDCAAIEPDIDAQSGTPTYETLKLKAFNVQFYVSQADGEVLYTMAAHRTVTIPENGAFDLEAIMGETVSLLDLPGGVVSPPSTVEYTVTFSAGANGTLTGTTTYTVEDGKAFDGIAPTIVPNEGFTANGWDKPLTTPITANTTFTAQYTEDSSGTRNIKNKK